MDGVIIEGDEKIEIVMKAFFEEFEPKGEPNGIVRCEIDASIDKEAFSQTMRNADELYKKEGFNEKGKFGMLRADANVDNVEE